MPSADHRGLCFHLRLHLNYFQLSHCLVWVLSLMVGSAMNVRPWIALQCTKVLLQVHVMQCCEYKCQIGWTLLRQASSSVQSKTAANPANCCCNRRSCPATTAAATEGLPSPCIFSSPLLMHHTGLYVTYTAVASGCLQAMRFQWTYVVSRHPKLCC